MNPIQTKAAKAFMLSLVLGLPLVASLAGCGGGLHLPPFPLPPTPTPTLTPGCANTTGLNILTADVSNVFPISVTLIATPAIPTATPTATPSSWIAALPSHTDGSYLLQTTADWNNYLATSNTPSSTLACPFNPATQALVICSLSVPCNGSVSITSVCNDGATLTVSVDRYAGCCGFPSSIFGYNTQALIVDRNGMAVSLNYTYHPLVNPMLCI